jgi:hypothetical protein
MPRPPKHMDTGSVPKNGTPAGVPGSKDGSSTVRLGRPLRRRYVIAGVATASVVAVFVILQGFGLIATGGSGSTARPVTLAEALQSASTTVTSVPGGPWVLTSAVGVAYSVSWSLNGSRLADQCSILYGSWSNASYRAGSGNYSHGQAGIWVLSFVGRAISSGILWVLVSYGTATQVAVVSASGMCSEYAGPALGTVVDSSVAMNKVLATANGSRFVEMFPRANVTYALGPGAPPIWTLELNACGSYAGGAGMVTSSVWASNGTLEKLPSAPVSC